MKVNIKMLRKLHKYPLATDANLRFTLIIKHQNLLTTVNQHEKIKIGQEIVLVPKIWISKRCQKTQIK